MNKEKKVSKKKKDATIIKQSLLSLKKQVGPDIIIVENINTPLSWTGHPEKKNQKRYTRTKQYHG
jgi:hypothetical protein